MIWVWSNMELVFLFIIIPPLTTWNYLCGQIWFLSLAMLYMFCIIVLAAQRVYMGAYYNFYVPLYLIAFSLWKCICCYSLKAKSVIRPLSSVNWSLRADLMYINKIWLGLEGSVPLLEVCPPGFQVWHQSRTQVRGGVWLCHLNFSVDIQSTGPQALLVSALGVSLDGWICISFLTAC